jgi:hypothetical protein
MTEESLIDAEERGLRKQLVQIKGGRDVAVWGRLSTM